MLKVLHKWSYGITKIRRQDQIKVNFLPYYACCYHQVIEERVPI